MRQVLPAFLLLAFLLIDNHPLSAQVLTEQTGISLPGISYGSVAWGDYDNDGDLDFLLAGSTLALYRNNGGNSFIQETGASLPASCSSSDVDWGDYDNDGDLDLVMLGFISERSARIYKNNGDRTFDWQEDIELPGLYLGSVAWGDYDNDGDLDLAINGKDNTDELLSKIFRNDREDGFTEIPAGIVPVSEGGMECGDFNNDNILDLLVTGRDFSGNSIAKVYYNSGDAEFSDAKADLTGVLQSSAAISDCNNDGNLDILLSGQSIYRGRSSIVFMNSGDLQFTENTAANLHGLNYCACAWGDYTNDGFSDIVISGYGAGYQHITKIYKNNNGSSFTEQTGIALTGMRYASLAWGDYDNDRDLDLLLCGQANPGGNTSKIYKNNTAAVNSKPTAPTNLHTRTSAGSALLSWNKSTDANGGQDGLTYNVAIGTSPGSIDIVSPMSDLNTGYRRIPEPGNAYNNTSFYIDKLETGTYYWRVQSIDQSYAGSDFSAQGSFTILPEFTEISTNIAYTYASDLAWGDYDNDGDLDLLQTGIDVTTSNRVTWIHRNNGNGTFTKQSHISFKGISNGSTDWADFNKDGYLDALVTGNDFNGNYSTSLYRNLGNNTFELVNGTSIPSLRFSDVDIGDFDNDGNPDIALTGFGAAGKIAKVYKNNANLTFSEQASLGAQGVYSSAVAWGDYDNDSDLDILFNGEASQRITRIYENMGSGNFSECQESTMDGIYNGSVDWGDYDSDGDLDVLVIGENNIRDAVTKMYRNDGNNVFTDINPVIRGVKSGEARWGDYDNDGDLDILLCGQSGTNVTEVYRNDNNDQFNKIAISLSGIDYGSGKWGDYDNDGDLDIIVSGQGIGPYALIFRNNWNVENASPTAPVNLSSERIANGILLSWDPANDDKTDSKCLSYNLRVGTQPGAFDVVCPLSDPNSGYLKIPQMGSCNLNTKWRINSLQQGRYYWSVQAVDNTFLGGEWSEEAIFDITFLLADFSSDIVCVGIETSFSDLSYSSGDPIIEWQWDFGDGTSSSLQHPIHTFAQSGTYSVQLIITSAQETDTITKDVIVKPKPAPNFTNNIACIGSVTTFSNHTITNGLSIDSWTWDFGDGVYSAEQNPGTHGYLNPGEYNVKLVALADNACVDSVSKNVLVGDYPVANIAVGRNPEICQGEEVKLSVPFVENYIYKWKIGGAEILDGDANEYYANISGSYSVSVTNPAANCVSDSPDPVLVQVTSAPPAPLIRADGDTVICAGDSVKLSVSHSDENSYIWMLNGGAVGTNWNKYYASAEGEYTLTLTNSSGCSTSSSNSISIQVLERPPLPKVNINGSTTFCEGESVTLSVSEPGTDSYQWFDQGLRLEGETGTSITTTASGIFSVGIANDEQCESNSQEIPVMVHSIPVTPEIQAQNYTLDDCQNEKPIILAVQNVEQNVNYQWNRNGFDIIGETGTSITGFLEEGDYSVVANHNTCSSESTSLTIRYAEAPKRPEIIAEGPNIWYLACSNDSASEYRWYLDGELIEGAKEYLYVAGIQEGKYEVGVSVNGSCFAMSDPVRIPLGTGIGENPWEHLKIYPNPTPGLFTIEMDNQIMGELFIDIFGESGARIINIKFYKETSHLRTQIDLSDQAPGSYLIRLLLQEYKASRTLIVE